MPPRTSPRLLLTSALLIGLIAGLLTSASASAATTPPKGCGVQGAQTKKHGDGTKIAVVRDDADDLYGGYTDVYVCNGKRKARHVVSLESVWPRFSKWTISGRTAAFVLSTWDSSCDKYGEPPEGCHASNYLYAFDARSGRKLVEASIPNDPLTLVVTAQGEVAWLVQRPETRELWFARADLKPVKLADDPAILPSSVLIGAGNAFWITGKVSNVPLP